jgi:ligand-binding sensor domain-containing protein/DNA-binding CsgD family transcriptional regulator
MIEQGGNGMMYFANNDGLLEFDGRQWTVYQLPNRTIVRCIKPDGEGRIYAGGFNEFGYFEKDASGRMSYHSLTEQVPGDKSECGEVWKIHLTPNGIVFQSFVRIIIIEQDRVEIIEAPNEFHFSFYVNGELYVVDRIEGLLRLAMGKLFPVVGTEILNGKEIWGILPYQEKLLIATAGYGIYEYDGGKLEVWGGKTSDLLSSRRVYCTALIGDSSIAFGTIQDGLYITDLQGNIYQSINREHGLQNNTVLSFSTDSYGNLWLGLDNGIDYIEINSPLSILSYHHGLSSGYAAIIHDSLLYLGTNQGLYAVNWERYDSYQNSNVPFKLVKNTSGQVWTLKVIDGSLFCGHNNGTYLVEGYMAARISGVIGGWTYLQLETNPEIVIGGTYSGLTLYEKTKGQWAFKRRISGFSESSREILEDHKNNIWMSHGLKGLYRIVLNERHDSVISTEFYDSSNGLPSNYDMTLLGYGDSIYFTTVEGIYYFDHQQANFRVSAKLEKILGKDFYRRITLDRFGNIWYCKDNRAGVFRLQEDGSYLDINLPFEQINGNFIGGFEFIYPYDENNVFFGAENGFIHYDPSFKKDYNKPISVFIREVVTTTNDSILYLGEINRSLRLSDQIDFSDNNLQFFFSANDFENPDKLEYATFLSGLDDSWSSWAPQSSREYTNLKEGEYVFHVKAKNIYGVESTPVSITFKIKPPLRRSVVAYLIYGVLVLAAVYIGILLINRKITHSRNEEAVAKERQFKDREEELQRISLEAEKEVIRLRNEKLKEEMLLKDKELANSTLQMIQKNKFLVSLKDELNELGNLNPDRELKYQIRSLIKKINKDIDTDSQWKVFETHFERVHEEFLKRIKADYPELTPGELKLCAYLRLNISSKEIALLMNISTRGVEISRYRLRKKLNLDRDTNLTDFIMSF